MWYVINVWYCQCVLYTYLYQQGNNDLESLETNR